MCRTKHDYIILIRRRWARPRMRRSLWSWLMVRFLPFGRRKRADTGHQRCHRRAEPEEEKVIGCVFGNVYPGFGERSEAAMVTVTDTAPIAGQNDEEKEHEQRNGGETYSAAEPEADLIAFWRSIGVPEIFLWCAGTCNPCRRRLLLTAKPSASAGL